MIWNTLWGQPLSPLHQDPAPRPHPLRLHFRWLYRGRCSLPAGPSLPSPPLPSKNCCFLSSSHHSCSPLAELLGGGGAGGHGRAVSDSVNPLGSETGGSPSAFQSMFFGTQSPQKSFTAGTPVWKPPRPMLAPVMPRDKWASGRSREALRLQSRSVK